MVLDGLMSGAPKSHFVATWDCDEKLGSRMPKKLRLVEIVLKTSEYPSAVNPQEMVLLLPPYSLLPFAV